MKQNFFLTLALALTLAGCGGIGEGSTVQSLKIAFSPADSRDQAVVIDDTLATRKVRMFDCFCSNLSVIGQFTDGTLATFNSRATWTSSDESVATVSNFGSIDTTCPIAQRVAGQIRPHGPGTAVITAEFLGIKSSMTVEVADTSVEANGTFALAPFDASNVDHAVPVSGSMPLLLSVTLDGRPRTVNLNGTFAFSPAADTVATIGATGLVSGHSADGGSQLNATATFPSCADVTVSTPVRVGEIVPPLTVAEEPAFANNPDAPSRGKLALSNNQDVKVTAQLDYDGNGTVDTTAPIDVSTQSKADFTDPCTTRVFNADPAFAPSQCEVNTTDTCGSSVSLCAEATATSCPSTLTTKCRTVVAPMSALISNRVTAVSASSAPTTIFATFPAALGINTTTTTALAASTAGAADTVTVSQLLGYPTVYPWDGKIEDEIVQVTGLVTGTSTSLNIVRGFAGTTAAAHDVGKTFGERSYPSLPNAIQLTSTAGTLTALSLDAVPAPALYQSMQLGATGTYTDSSTSTVTVTQPVTHTTVFSSGTPNVIWSSNRTGIVTVGPSSGLVTPSSPCGGQVVIRVRASTSTNATSGSFAAPATRGDATDDGAHNTLDNDAACGTDPLCDQVIVNFPRASPLPPGFTAAICDAL